MKNKLDGLSQRQKAMIHLFAAQSELNGCGLTQAHISALIGMLDMFSKEVEK